MRTPCSICGLPSVGRELCKKHYRAFMKYGDPLKAANLRGIPFDERYQHDPETGCWLWIGSCNTSGYGIFTGLGERTAHRYSWVHHNGPIPEGMHVLHECDRPECVNPKHLRLGTHQDNMRDLRERGRAYGAAGEANFGAKLSEDQVLAIRDDPRSAKKIAAEYGVSASSIANIKLRKTWKHLI